MAISNINLAGNNTDIVTDVINFLAETALVSAGTALVVSGITKPISNKYWGPKSYNKRTS